MFNQMYDFCKHLCKVIIDILAPSYCLACYTPLDQRTALCQVCMMQIEPVAPFDLYVGAKMNVPVFALSAYKI